MPCFLPIHSSELNVSEDKITAPAASPLSAWRRKFFIASSLSGKLMNLASAMRVTTLRQPQNVANLCPVLRRLRHLFMNTP